MSAARSAPLTVWVSAKEVAAALNCSRATAYLHLHRAAQRTAGKGGMVRVALEVWEDYALALFGPSKPKAATEPPPASTRRQRPRGLRLVASNGASTDLTIRPTTPRTVKR